ncbi:MAG: hypothetical protein IKM28_03825 [Lachnospiraceae bacterium]|nr:hypothetical protein [Lachnospiraceae bacterium]
MGILHSEVHYNKLITDLSKCCLTESVCTTCDKPSCIIGYAQNCIINCAKNQITYVEGGDANVPTTDFKLYEVDNLEKGIAHILKMCRSCKTQHYDQCIISVVRNCYEIGLFGETFPYDGSNLRYLNYIYSKYPENAQRIIDEFHDTVFGDKTDEDWSGNETENKEEN